MNSNIVDRKYEDGSMYITLAPVSANHWHCGIYIVVSDTYGMLYHASNKNDDSKWNFQERMTENIVAFHTIVAALHIATDIQEQRLASVHDILVATPVIADGGMDPKWGLHFESSVWVMEALDRLRAAGLIPNEPAKDVVEEAYRLAHLASLIGSKEMRKSDGLIALGGRS
ncbi:hypothetical protein V501_06514 [Pseudogymnoascus sp. VKM F-4519 (FW-2642)]|nr:hypothetical protein V501_06514 [Pseudogymnoascus sp. VKM F-4519 (FW-2642)]